MGTEIPTLYLLVSGEEDNLCLSPYAWSTQLAMKHKKINFEEEYLRFSQIKETINQVTHGKWGLVPTIKFSEDDVLFDSKPIAIELDKRYPNGPKLFPNGPQLANFLSHYTMYGSLPFFGLALDTEVDTYKEKDKLAFKRIYEEFQFTIDTPDKLYPEVAKFLKPIELMLKSHQFLEGDQTTFSDYIVFGYLQWFRVMTPLHFKHTVEDIEDKTVFKWFESILDLYDGYARSFPVNTQYGEFAKKI